jgi:hypothetical protein
MKPSRRFLHNRHKFVWYWSLATAAALIAAAPSHADAQDADTHTGLQFLLTPYFWAPHVTTSVATPIPQLPNATETVGFGQIFTHLGWIPFTGMAEIRDGSFGVLLDYIHTPLRTGITTRNVFFNGGTGSLVENIGTAVFLYRPFSQPQQYLDVGVGVRPWGISTSLSLNPGALPGTSFSTGGSWADPIVAFRYHHELESGFGLTVYGDVGGFGLAAHTDWQVLGTIDYALGPRLDLHLGYRSLNVNYTASRGIGFKVNMNGPLFSATFHL